MSNPSPVEILYHDFCEEDVVPKKRKAEWEIGLCIICGKEKESLPAGSLLGQTFGSWSEMAQFNVTSRLCKSCAWSFKDKRLLRHPFLVTPDKATILTWDQLGKRLRDHYLTANEAIVAPVGGRKIVAPYAKWGHVTGDYGAMKWDKHYRKAMLACYQLHSVGIRGSLLLEPVVPFKILSAVPADKHQSINSMWNYLSFIREDKTLSGLFVKVSMNINKEGTL